MSKRKIIQSAFMAITVLFAILFQSLHSYEHISKTFSEEKSAHHYSEFEKNSSTQVHDSDHCFVCDFTFSSFVTTESFTFSLQFPQQEIPYFFNNPEAFISQNKIVCSLRGPPAMYCFI